MNTHASTDPTGRAVVVVPVTFHLKRIADLLVGAFEGGSNYWYRIEEFHKPPKRDFVFDAEHVYRHAEYPLSEGGWLVVSDYVGAEGEGMTKTRLDTARLLWAVGEWARRYPTSFARWQTEDDDAEDADVFLQIAVLGDVVYG